MVYTFFININDQIIVLASKILQEKLHYENSVHVMSLIIHIIYFLDLDMTRKLEFYPILIKHKAHNCAS